MPSIRLLAAALASARANYTLPRLHPRAPLSYREQELRYAQHHMYVDVKHKLLYCAVPKVACTEFMRLFFRLKGENQNQRWKGDPHFRQDKPLFNKIMNVTTATALMNDPTWTKFAFWRDPAERLLSAYLDKFANGSATRRVDALLAKVRRAYAMDYEMFDAVGFGGDEPASGANWGDAKYAGRQTMGGFDRAFKDDHGVRAWS
ncbi:chondroitin 4-sulfotransferase [Aureococcus anophagefferens]|nr:chondroitin 4-sulfotransferase [Aureococcus anophagefferens]